ncbi:hypothetical protein E2C01_072495 [Portunus trituberculatus]|uniref:Uncharacterized protein n=1 Tax=Portunus trituberculatus TaxID=210409 RepID=A0A5B7I2R1_PORTR|nr:hypothetical protein [Portunus trituberculatus]
MTILQAASPQSTRVTHSNVTSRNQATTTRHPNLHTATHTSAAPHRPAHLLPYFTATHPEFYITLHSPLSG